MGLRNLVAILIILFVTQVVISAQTAEPSAPWPPDPNAIFEDGVEWKAVVSSTEPARPDIQIDNERQLIQLINSTGSVIQEFNFPAETSSVIETIRVPDEQIQVEGLTDTGDPLSKKFFLLDPATGAYRDAPTVCDGQKARTDFGAPQWTFVALDEQNNSGFLCDTETDAQSTLLPEEFNDWHLLGSSEDRQSQLLWSRAQENCCDYFFFVYHVATDQITSLGTIPPNWDDSFSLSGWINSTQGLICRYTFHQYIPRACYRFDLHQQDSLEYLFSGWPETMFGLDDPLRFGAFYSEIYYTVITGGGFARHSPCSLTLYDQQGVQKKVLGYECIPLKIDDYQLTPYIQREDVLYYLTTEKRLHSEVITAKASVLKSYDFRELRGNYFIYKGEIESLLSISPDHRYAVILADDNGLLDFPFQPYKTTGERGWRVGILDITSRQLIYQSEPVGVYAASQVTWLDDQTVVMASTTYSATIPITDPEQPDAYPAASTLLRIELDPSGSTPEIQTTTEFGYRQRGVIDIRPALNACYLLLDDQRIVNLYTFEEVAVLRDDSPAVYDFSVWWRDNNKLYVSIGSKEDTDKHVGYEIMLPDCTPQQP